MARTYTTPPLVRAARWLLAMAYAVAGAGCGLLLLGFAGLMAFIQAKNHRPVQPVTGDIAGLGLVTAWMLAGAVWLAFGGRWAKVPSVVAAVLCFGYAGLSGNQVAPWLLWLAGFAAALALVEFLLEWRAG